MRTQSYDLTGFADLHANTSVDVFRGERAELRVPHRATIQINYAIAYFWLPSIPFEITASIDSTENEIIVSVDLTEPLFSKLMPDEHILYLNFLRGTLAEWVHEKFLTVLRQHLYIFEETEQ